MSLRRLSCCLLLGSAISFSATVWASAQSDHRYGFQSAEHIFMGDEVEVSLPGAPASDEVVFTLKDGIHMRYGDILAMPDYYGDPKHAISSEKTQAARQARFTALYESFSSKDPDYFHHFWPIVQNERKKVYEAVEKGQDPSGIYTGAGSSEDITLALATQLKYLLLAVTDYDHFGHDAELAYQAGHAVAVQTAITAKHMAEGQIEATNQACRAPGVTVFSDCLQQQAVTTLKRAYAQNAFASHFLADRFAGGHVRTPLRQLHSTRPIAVLGSLSGNMMHNEDNRLGVVVRDASGQAWRAYGDDFYFSKQNLENRRRLKETLQLSADEVYQAFMRGEDTDPASQQLLQHIPQALPAGSVTMIAGVGQVKQTQPLYEVIKGHVWQRWDINNPYNLTKSWLWSTLLTELFYKHPKAEPVLSTRWRLILKATGQSAFLSQLKQR
jgi:hypothetical protein